MVGSNFRPFHDLPTCVVLTLIYSHLRRFDSDTAIHKTHHEPPLVSKTGLVFLLVSQPIGPISVHFVTSLELVMHALD